MKLRATAAFAVGMLLILEPPALAHVTVQPNEAVKETFSRFVVRVPNERPDSATTKIRVELPPLAFVSFEPKDGWKRRVVMRELDEPIEAFGAELSEVVGSVTWSGGHIGGEEFDEFGFSALTPDEETTLRFEAFQTYSDGETVAWTGPAEAEEPAATLNVYDIGAGENEGQLAVLARLNDQVARLAHGGGDEGDSTVPVALSVVAVVAAGAALFTGMRR